jgi:hypothetical protein
MNSENFHKYAAGSENDSLEPNKDPKDYSSFYFYAGVIVGWLSMFLAIIILFT